MREGILGEQRVETIMAAQFSTTEAVAETTNGHVKKLALNLGLRSHYVLCVFFQTVIHTSPMALRYLRKWTNLRLRRVQNERERQGQSEENKKGNSKSKEKKTVRSDPMLEPMKTGEFIISGMYELVLEARRDRLRLGEQTIQDTFFALSQPKISSFTAGDFLIAQKRRLHLQKILK